MHKMAEQNHFHMQHISDVYNVYNIIKKKDNVRHCHWRMLKARLRKKNKTKQTNKKTNKPKKNNINLDFESGILILGWPECHYGAK